MSQDELRVLIQRIAAGVGAMKPTFERLVVDHAPCTDGEHHTSYIVVPAEPGHACVFPEMNFCLTSAEHREAIRRRMLDEFGLILDEPGG
jgi:hypothetical protein